MNDITQVDPVKLSMTINSLRSHLSKRGFFEHHLYSTQNYRIENVPQFKLNKGLYLRYNPEPDIWQIGDRFDKFFWIGSMYRNEKKLSRIHKYEFTVLDTYLRNGDMKSVAKNFLELLKTLERDLDLGYKLSQFPVEYVKYAEFDKIKFTKSDNFWYIVTDYPKNESFYDQLKKGVPETEKFEIYCVKDGEEVEIAACGVLGKNHNAEMFIKNGEKYLSNTILKKKFIGFGVGLERLLYLYS